MQEMQEMWVQLLGQEAPLEKDMATRSSILAWEIPWTEEPGSYSPWDSSSDTAEQLNTHTCMQGARLSGFLPIPFMNTEPSWPNHLPKLSLKPHRTGDEVSACGVLRDTNIPSCVYDIHILVYTQQHTHSHSNLCI